MINIITKFQKLFPYFIVIFLYFFFINLEARNDQSAYDQNQKIIKIKKPVKENNVDPTNKNLIIKIPVIPYKE